MNDFVRRILLLPVQGSALARSIDHLHYFVIFTTMAGWLGVTLVAVYFVIKYRRRSPTQTTRQVKATIPYEATVIGTLLFLFILWWALGYSRYVAIREPPANAMEVYVTGKQWMWKFSYPDGRSSLSVLTVPAGQPVKLLMTSRDVIHSFFLPDFRVKQDVLPGRYTQLWFTADKPGTYQIFCAEYCGLLHSNMWGSVVALSPQDWERWLAETSPRGLAGGPGSATAPAVGKEAAFTPQVPITSATGQSFGLADQGRAVADRFGCFNCHTTDGRPHIGPSWKGLYGATVEMDNGDRVVADESYLTESMMDPRKRIVRGFQPVMPSYQGILGPAETAALVELIKSLSTGLPAPAAVIPPWPGTAGNSPAGTPVPKTEGGGPTPPNAGPGQRSAAQPEEVPRPPPAPSGVTPTFEEPQQ